MSRNLGNILSVIESNLPICLEESADVVDAIVLSDLIASASSGDTRQEVGVVVQFLDRIFAALCLTQETDRQAGRWRFRSYPAWLLARSILNILKTEGQTVFDPGYWATNCPEGVVDEQRKILKFVENARQQFHPEQCAPAIRFVYVAWAVVFLDGKILMYHREDKKRKDAAGNFGLPGGRFKIEDAPATLSDIETIRDFATGESHWPLAFLDKTLAREIHEELGLHRDDYTFTPLVELEPYAKVEGGKNNHALTEYRMRLYSIKLTQRGLVHLFDEVLSKPESFSWFSEEELFAGKNSTGDMAFVDAIAEHKKRHPDLNLANESFTDSFLRQEKSGAGITIPLTPDQPILEGKNGKPLATIHADLTQDEHEWLLALACHAKELPFENASHSLLPYGWVGIRDEDALPIASLKAKLEKAGIDTVEMLDGRYARFSVTPSAIYFHDDCFSYSLSSEERLIELKLIQQSTAIGIAKAQTRSAKVSWAVFQSFMYAAGIKSGDYSSSDEIKRMINEKIGGIQKQLGLRMLIDNSAWCFYVPQEGGGFFGNDVESR